MRTNKELITQLLYLIVLSLLVCQAASAQLMATVSLPKIIGQRATVKLSLANHLSTKIESARAVCFLLDDQGKLIGQSTKWVIGQNKTELASGATNTFNFVITSPQPFTITNLTANISFSRVVLADGKLADVRHEVIVTPVRFR